MIGIVDYNAGNIKSVERALSFLKADYIASKNPRDLEKCEKLIFPGVGEAAYAMNQLKISGFDLFLKDWALSGRPLAGICLGSQIIFEYSEEGDVNCLGILEGIVCHFKSLFALAKMDFKKGFKFPHIGWNNLHYENGGSLFFEGIDNHSDFYFVHSYVIQPKDFSIIKGYADYGVKVPSCIEKDNIIVFQFHPEKSGNAGLRILNNFIKGQVAFDA